jgi:cbb3-type cytochrome oxidase cytochrome c subunit
MKGLIPLFVGLFGTFTFSWVGLTVIPNLQIGALNPQIEEDDRYPMPQSGMVEHGRSIYAANGCIYCHSRQVRPDYASSDIDRKWGVRRSAPRDYIFDRPVLLGKERLGPDLANVGKRGEAQESPAPNAAPPGSPEQSPAAPGQSPAASSSPAAPAPPAGTNASPAASVSPNPTGEPSLYSEAWHHKHLYAPRSMNPDTRDSTMPAYQFLYEKRRISGERSADALQLTGSNAPSAGWEVVPTYDAKCLVAYLMAQDQTHPLKEVKGMPGAAPPAAAAPAASPGAPAAAPAGSPAPQPQKK